MQWIKAFFMTWGMFLAIPCPWKVWDEKSQNKTLVCFPFIGIIVGLIWAFVAFLLAPVIYPVRAVLIAVLPWAATGFMHLDGYMDVCDAVFSRRDLETRRRILKDSHSGSFAIIFMCILAMAQWSVGWFTTDLSYVTLAIIPIATRACAGIAITSLPAMETSQYKKMEANKKHTLALLVILCVSIALPFILMLATPLNITLTNAFAPLIATVFYWLMCFAGTRNLKGMNGDISGFSLAIAEFAAYAFLCLF